MTTLIEWTHLINETTNYIGDSWNPITGCRKKSPACDRCYAIEQSKGLDRKLGHKTSRYQVFADSIYNWNGQIFFSEDLLLKKILSKNKKPKAYFVCSISDIGLGDRQDLASGLSVSLVGSSFQESNQSFFDEYDEVYRHNFGDRKNPNKKRFDMMRDFIFATICMSYMYSGNERNKFLFVTKRPDVLREYLENLNTDSGYARLAAVAKSLLKNNYNDLSREYKSFCDYVLVAKDELKKNFQRNLEKILNHAIWFGVTIESQSFMDRLDVLSSIPYGQKHFVSAEPLLTPLDFGDRKFDWLILGGESGTLDFIRETPMTTFTKTIANARRLKNPPAIFMKQMGSHLGRQYPNQDKKGGNYETFPPEIKIQEFPPFD